ncbi:hypothetical protein ACLKA7_002535 [Drosophila subpalustris]
MGTIVSFWEDTSPHLSWPGFRYNCALIAIQLEAEATTSLNGFIVPWKKQLHNCHVDVDLPRPYQRRMSIENAYRVCQHQKKLRGGGGDRRSASGAGGRGSHLGPVDANGF